jgi:hypothetical protein
MTKRWIYVLMLAACSRSSDQPTPPPPGNTGDTWIRGDVEQRFGLVAKHLRGFDVAMVETGYRYGELYWAGEDGNWEYAAYQLDKIETAIANGIERRPKRAASASMLTPAIERLRAAVVGKHASGFADAFVVLTETCNTCHIAEKVAFVHVAPPPQRGSVVRPPTTSGISP